MKNFKQIANLYFFFTVLSCYVHGQTDTLTIKFIESQDERQLKFPDSIFIGEIRFFQGEILQEVEDWEDGKKVLFFGDTLEIIYTDKPIEETPDTRLNYTKIYATDPEGHKQLVSKYDSLKEVLIASLSRRLVNGKEKLVIDLSDFDQNFGKLMVGIAVNDSKKINLKEMRSYWIDWDASLSALRIIPEGYPTVFCDSSMIQRKAPMNDSTRYELFYVTSEAQKVRVLKERTSGQYFLANEHFKPQSINSPHTLKSGNLLKLNDQMELVIVSPGLPLFWWVIIGVISVIIIGVFVFWVYTRPAANKPESFYHKIKRKETPQSIVDQYSGLKNRDTLIDLNHDLLGIYEKSILENKKFSSINHDLVGKCILIEPINHNDSKKIRKSALKTRSASEELDQEDFGWQSQFSGKDIVKSIRNIEKTVWLLAGDQAKLGPQNELNELIKLKNSNKELSNKIDLLFESLRHEKNEEKDLLNHMQVERDKFLQYQKKIERSVLFLSEDAKPFADNRIQVLESALGAINTLYEQLNRSYQISALEEARGLGLMLKHDKNYGLLADAIKCLHDLHHLRNSSIWTEQDHIRKLATEKDEEAQLDFIDRSIYESVFKPFLSRVLVMLEDAKNLGRLISRDSDIVSDVQTIGAKASEIRNSAYQLLAIEISYVPLFDPIENHFGQVSAVHREVDLLYSNVKLSKNDIQQIVSYGMEYKDITSQTEVIIKSK